MNSPLLKSLVSSWKWLKYVFAAVPIIWIFSTIDMQRLGSTLGHIAWWTIPLLVLLLLSTITLQGIRWWMLIRAFLPHIRFGRAMVCHFVSLLYSTVLPTSAAQDVVRALLISREGDYGVVWAATWLSRLMGLVVLALLSLYGFFTVDPAILPHGWIYALGMCVALLALTCISFSKRLTRPLGNTARQFLPKKISEALENVREAIYRFRGKKGMVAAVMGVTLIHQLLYVINITLLVKGITGTFYFTECLTFMPAIEIICLSLPLTPNGVGIREALTALLFHRMHIADSALGTYIILIYAVGIPAKLIGVFLLPFVDRKPASSAPRT